MDDHIATLKTFLLTFITVWVLNLAKSFVYVRLFTGSNPAITDRQTGVLVETAATLIVCAVGGLIVRLMKELDRDQAAIGAGIGTIAALIVESLIYPPQIWYGQMFEVDEAFTSLIQLGYMLRVIGGPLAASAAAHLITRSKRDEWPPYQHVGKQLFVVIGLFSGMGIPVLTDFAIGSEIYSDIFIYGPMGFAIALTLALLPDRWDRVKFIALALVPAIGTAIGYTLHRMLFSEPFDFNMLLTQAALGAVIALALGLTAHRNALLTIIGVTVAGMGGMAVMDALGGAGILFAPMSAIDERVTPVYIALIGGRVALSIVLGLLIFRNTPATDYATVQQRMSRPSSETPS